MDSVSGFSHITTNCTLPKSVLHTFHLILDSHPTINCVPSIQSTVTMKCPKSQYPFVFQSSQLITLCTLTVPLLMAGPSQLLTSGLQKINQTNSDIGFLTAVIVGAAIPKMLVQARHITVPGIASQLGIGPSRCHGYCTTNILFFLHGRSSSRYTNQCRGFDSVALR